MNATKAFSDSISRQWVYYIAAIVMGFRFLFSLGIRESRTSLILQRKILILRRETGDHSLRIRNPDEMITLRTWIQECLLRPMTLLLTEPIIILCSILNAIAFALIYGLTEALVVVYQSFGFSPQTASLSFFAIMVGVTISVIDRIYDERRFKYFNCHHIPVTPEMKIRSFSVAIPALAIGLWWFAWTIPPLVRNVPWIVSMLALIPVGFATNDLDTVLCGYMADTYTIYAASAFSALAFLRSLLAAGFPLFAETMFTKLGSNVAASILAAVATMFCISPIILLKYGKKMREKSTFARYSFQLSQEASLGGNDRVVA